MHTLCCGCCGHATKVAVADSSVAGEVPEQPVADLVQADDAAAAAGTAVPIAVDDVVDTGSNQASVPGPGRLVGLVTAAVAVPAGEGLGMQVVNRDNTNYIRVMKPGGNADKSGACVRQCYLLPPSIQPPAPLLHLP